jgi:hypothetical protein
MLLALPNDVRDQLGFDDMSDIAFAIRMAMDAADPYLQAQLNTDFVQGTYVDTFYVREPPYLDGPAVETQFRLRHGMVSALTSVLTAFTPASFSTQGAQVTNVTANVFLEDDRGIVKDFTTRYVRQFVQITYASGFAPDPNNPASYLISAIPDWLQNACKIKTLIGLVDSPVLSEAQIKLDQNLLGSQLVALLSRKLRYAPMSLLPL